MGNKLKIIKLAYYNFSNDTIDSEFDHVFSTGTEKSNRMNFKDIRIIIIKMFFEIRNKLLVHRVSSSILRIYDGGDELFTIFLFVLGTDANATNE